MKTTANLLAATGILLGSCLVASAGAVVAWGYNNSGQTNVPAGLSNVVSVAAGDYHSLAATSDGTVVAWGAGSPGTSGFPNYDQSTVPAGLSNVVAIAAGYLFSLALKSDGTVVGWGYDNLGTWAVPANLSNVVALAAGNGHGLALKSNGFITAWGNNDFGECNVDGAVYPARALDAGVAHSLAVRRDGIVFAWGWNDYGQCNVPAGLSNVIAVAAGYQHSLALRADGSIVAWGPAAIYTNIPPDATNIVAIAAGNYHSLALRNDGQLLVWGSSYEGSCTVPPGISNWVAIAGGLGHSVTVTGNNAPQFLPGQPNLAVVPDASQIIAGNTLIFHVAAVGAGTPTYFWRLNGTNLTTTTQPTLTLTNAWPAQSGLYSVIVSNAYGLVESSNLPVNIVPAIIGSPPTGGTAFGGDNVNFYVYISGPSSSFQWRFNDVDLPGEMGQILTVYNVTTNSAGSYSVVVSNAYGTVVSPNADLAVIPLAINSQPANRTIYIGESASFGPLNLQQNGPWYYQWRFNGADLPGETNAALTIANATTNQAGNYSVLVSNPYGALESSNGVLTVLPAPPTLILQPVDQKVVVGSNAAFTVAVGGTPPFNYQWYLNGTALADDTRITGSAGSSLNISNVQTADGGNYTVTITNLSGSVTSTSAVLTVLVPPSITTQPVGRSVPLGLPASFSASVVGTAPLSYQWQLNGTDIPGATGTSYSISAAGTNDFGVYHLVISNAIGVATCADALLTWGQIAAWGRNDYGQTVVPPNLTNVVMISGGGAGANPGHSLALRTDGTVVAWGYNANGQTNVPASATNVVAVAAGGMHSLALRANGTVIVWGNNTYGQTTVPSSLSNVVAVVAGGNHSLALRSDGKVVAWGYNIYGQTDVPASLIEVVAIGAGANHSLAVRSDGTVVAWGANDFGQSNIPEALTNVVAVVGGNYHNLALKADGTVASWGYNYYGQINVPARATNVIAIAAGVYYSVVLNADGTVVVWGINDFNQANVPAGVSNAVAIAGGSAHVLALIGDGRPLITRQPVSGTANVGRNFALQATVTGTTPLNCRWQFNGVDVPNATNTALVLSNLTLTNAGNYQLIVSNAVGVAASLTAPLTVLSNNTLSFWSQPAAQTNYQGSKMTLGMSLLGNGPLRYQWYFSVTNKNYAAIPGTTNDSLILDPALVVQSGNYYVAVSNQFAGITSSPVNVRVLFARAWGFQAVINPPVNVTNAIAIATGGYNNYYGHYFALGADGKLTSWANYTVYYGETNVSALSNSFVTAIAAGSQTSLALRSDGTVYAWGYGYYGQTNVPSGLNNVVAIACSDYHDLALKSDGTVIAWGQNNYGEATNSLAATNAAVAIAAGTYHNLGLRADGTVFGWGYNGYGQTTIPTAATNVIAIAAGQYHSLALRANGTVVGWGYNGGGQISIPAGLSNIVAIAASSSHSTLLRADGTIVPLGYVYIYYASNAVPADLANVIAISSGGDHDFGLLGTRAPAITIQPLSRTVFKGTTNVLLAAKVSGVQPATYQWRFNRANIIGATNDTLSLTNLQFAQAGAYQLIASNSYGVTFTKAAKVFVTLPLGEALDTTNRVWITSSNALWYGQTNVTHDGVDAARSGDIGNNQETILQTTLATNGPGHCTFWWKVSSEDYFDILEFRVNGVTQAAISGEVDWQPCSIAIPTGTNTVQWRYSKDASFGSGQDAGWVDQFTFLPDPPVITLQPVSQTVNMGTNVQFRVTATGYQPFFVQWWQNGTNAIGTGSMLTLYNVDRAQNGVYSVVVSNVGGSTSSSNAVLKVLVPQKLGTPVLLPDGTLLLTSGDADGGLLSASDLPNFEARVSTNLTDWITLTNGLSLTNGMLWLQDNSATNCTQRFYRIIENP